MSELKRTLIEDVFYPPHEKRHASTLYRKTHNKLILEMDTPCWICGIRHSDVVKLPKEEQSKWQMETHHSELEWAAASAFATDKKMLQKLSVDFALIMNDPDKLRQWLDSEGNMLVLCATHHRGLRTGIHSITYPAWKLQRYEYDGGFQFIANPN
jgi:hypothetical protein